MNNTEGVKLYWEDPAKSWHHPIYSNRNKIVKRFLQSDCDFLMMQDDDIIPVGHNPAEIVYADKDIVGCPAKVRADGGTLDWVAYYHNKEAGGYVAVDMAHAPSDADLLKVAVVGTGLICIKRKVLEAIKAPFLVENDEDGVCEWGTDFAFCRRAGALGFEVYTTPWRVCEHVKEMGFLDISGYDDSDNTDLSNQKYGIVWGNWAIQQKDWRFIKDVMEEHDIKKVVEFGAGLSSLLMSERADVVSYETKVDWAIDIEGKKRGNSLKVELWDGLTIPAVGAFAQPDGLDLVFIDGPPACMNGGPGRRASYEAAIAMAPRFVITHDSGRPEEQALAADFLRKKYTFVKKNGNHQTRCELWRLREKSTDV